MIAVRLPAGTYLFPQEKYAALGKGISCQAPAPHLPVIGTASWRQLFANATLVRDRLGSQTLSIPRSSKQALNWSSKRHITKAATQATDKETEAANTDVAGALGAASVEVETKEWLWEGYKIRYQQAGTSGPPILCIHGFGANCDHWRKNLPVLGQSHRVFAIDLLGYGFSDKPNPRGLPPNTLYTFETWANQARAFMEEIVGEPAFLVCNSVGGNVGLVTALAAPSQVRGLLLLNVSLRQLHIKKQQWFAKPFVKALQTTLRTTSIGQMFFASVAKPAAVKSILQQCYCDEAAVTDELVKVILEPGLEPGAVDVFLDFICYSGGPLPEEMLPLVKCPVLIGWGEEDPWEPVALGRAYGEISTVDEFVVLPGVGHCPQDEAPHLVNPLVERFVAKHA